jgi:hypothetical protein
MATSVKSFVLLVRQMRQAQQAYFDSKGPDGRRSIPLLMQSKALEKKVDEIIAATDINSLTSSI